MTSLATIDAAQNFVPDFEWCEKMLGWFGRQPGGDSLAVYDRNTLARTLLSLQTTLGRAKIKEYAKLDGHGMIKAILQCIRDGNMPDDKEAWITLQEAWDKKNGCTTYKIVYMPSIHALKRAYRHSMPDCALFSRCWSKFEYRVWAQAVGRYGHPGPDDAPWTNNEVDGELLLDISPMDPDYELKFVQIIKERYVENNGNIHIMKYSKCYSAGHLDKMARNMTYNKQTGQTESKKNAWKTDRNEMYIKTAMRNFIKHDMGIADADSNDTQTERQSHE